MLSIFCSVTMILAVPPVHSAQGEGIFYIDCNGSDENSGTSPGEAWKTLAKANAAGLLPGQSLLFKRGCTWQGTLKASWNGTSWQPILIGAYGSGVNPLIRNGPLDLADGYHNNVDITGSYLIIENIETTIVDPPVAAGCLDNPIGFFIGFNFRNPDNVPNGGSHNVLRGSKATFHTAGVHMNSSTHHNRVLDSVFTDNNVMERLTPISIGAADDIGAWGILLKGSSHEIAHNFLSRNNAICTYDTSPQGNSIELYEARHNLIHHNIAVDDRVFTEVGSSATIISENNTFAYNLIVSSVFDARFLTTRGSGSEYGPVYATRLYNNTVYFTGQESQGMVCGAGCSTNMLTARNNIFWAEEKAAFSDGDFEESNNIFWSSTGSPTIQFLGFAINENSMAADPLFVDPDGLDFHLQSASPAIDTGMSSCWPADLDGIVLPQGGAYDIGSYEFALGLPPLSGILLCGPEAIYLPLLAR